MPFNERSLYSKVILVFVSALALCGFVIHLVEQNEVLHHQSAALEVASVHGHLLQEQTARSLSATYALAAVLRQGGGKIDDFDAIASEMLSLYGGISALQLAPNGVISQIVPLKGNEAALGHNLLADPDRNREAFAAVQTRKLTLAGPFTLRQGGVAVVGRLPVFLPDPSGNEKFWGFTTALIRIPDLLAASQLSGDFSADYAYELSRIHPDTWQREVFWNSSGRPLEDPLSYRITVPNGEWTLSVSRIKGWHSSRMLLGLSAVAAVLVSLMAAFLAYNLLRQPHLLKQEVALRTAELTEANASLQAEIVEHWQTELALRNSESQLEAKVQERTAQLTAANAALQDEHRQQKILIDKLAEAQNHLLQSEMMASIGQLAAGVAHEINNPLGFISSNLGVLRGYAEGLLEMLAAYEREAGLLLELQPEARARLAELKERLDLDYVRSELPDLLGDTQGGVARVKRIVQDLKEFSSVDREDWQLADVEQGIEATLGVVAHELRPGIRLSKEYGPLPRIDCVPLQINQVFLILLQNAAQAIEGEGEVKIRTGQEDGWVSVEIADTGKGIEQEHLMRIFEPFFTTKPVGQGTGLGLSLAYSIVKRHGGRIEVASEPGQGSVFRVWLPVRRAGGDPTPDPRRV